MVDEQLIELRPALAVIWRRKLLVAAITCLALVLALGYSLAQPKVYTAKARFVVSPETPQSALGLSGPQASRADAGLSAETQAAVASSSVIAARAAKALGLETSPDRLAQRVTVTPVGDALLALHAQASGARAAADLANAFAQQYLDYRKEQALRVVASASDDIEKRAADTEKQLDDVDARVVELSGAVALLPAPISRPLTPTDVTATPAQAVDRASKEAEIERLNAKRGQLLSTLSVIRTRGEDLATSQLLAHRPGEIVQIATPPTSPTSPTPVRNGAAGALLGAVLGLVIAFVTEHLDRRLHTRDGASQAAGAPVLASVPRVTGKRRKRLPLLFPENRGFQAAVDSYRALRANLASHGLGAGLRSILITSARPGEGKSTTAANLAMACAGAGLSTLVVGGDQGSSRLHSVFAVACSLGLMGVLRGELKLEAAVVATRRQNLWVLVAGTVQPDDPDLLGSPALARFMTEAVSHYDVVVIDGPPVTGADAITLAGVVDASLLVVQVHVSERSAVRSAAVALAHAGSPPFGVVLVGSSRSDDTVGFFPQAGFPTGPQATTLSEPVKSPTGSPPRTAEERLAQRAGSPQATVAGLLTERAGIDEVRAGSQVVAPTDPSRATQAPCR